MKRVLSVCSGSPAARVLMLGILFWRFIGASWVDTVCQLMGYDVVVLRASSLEVSILTATFFGCSPEVVNIIHALRGVGNEKLS